MRRLMQHAAVPLVFLAVMATGCAATGEGKTTPTHDCDSKGVFWDLERGCEF